MDIPNINKEKLSEFARENKIKFIVLFGSQASDNSSKESDFDIAVLSAPDKNIKDFENYSNVSSGLSEILNIPDYKLDLTNLNNADPLLRYEIVFGGKLLYGDEDAYAQYQSFAFRDYVDAKPLFDLEDFLIRKKQLLLKKALA